MYRFKRRSTAIASVAALSIAVFLISLPAWALDCNNCVDQTDITDSQVRAAEIATNAVGSSELAAGAVRGADLGGLPVAKVCSDDDQSIPHNTFTTLNFFREAFDPYAMHNSASPSLLTAPMAGIYAVHASVFWQGVGTGGVRQMNLHKGGDIVAAATNVPAGSTSVNTDAQALVKMQAGESVIVRVAQNSGGALNVQGDGGGCFTPVFEMHMVSGI